MVDNRNVVVMIEHEPFLNLFPCVTLIAIEFFLIFVWSFSSGGALRTNQESGRDRTSALWLHAEMTV